MIVINVENIDQDKLPVIKEIITHRLKETPSSTIQFTKLQELLAEIEVLLILKGSIKGA